MQTSLVIYGNILVSLFQMYNDTLSQKGKGPPSLLALKLFEIVLEAEDQNNDFDMPDPQTLFDFI